MPPERTHEWGRKPDEQRELRSAAVQLASYVAMNGGAFCLAPRMILTARGWSQREEFLQQLRCELERLPARVPFHPTTAAALGRATATPTSNSPLRPTLRSDLDPQQDNDLITGELFAPAILEFPLSCCDLDAWLAEATDVANGGVFGALSAYVFAASRTLTLDQPLLDAAIARLPHGTVAINCWTGLGYGLGSTPWGVPASAATMHGRGFVRGIPPRSGVKRTVIEASLRPRPLPPWLPAHRRSAQTLRALCRFFCAPSVLRLARVASLGLQHF